MMKKIELDDYFTVTFKIFKKNKYYINNIRVSKEEFYDYDYYCIRKFNFSVFTNQFYNDGAIPRIYFNSLEKVLNKNSLKDPKIYIN